MRKLLSGLIVLFSLLLVALVVWTADVVGWALPEAELTHSKSTEESIADSDISEASTARPVFVKEAGRLAMPISSIAANGDVVYAVSWNRLQIVDFSTSQRPVTRGTAGPYFFPGGQYPLSFRDVSVKDEMAYVTTHGLLIIDVADPDRPRQVSYLSMPSECYAVAVENEYAYMGCGYNLKIVDVSDPTTPHEVGSSWYSGFIEDVAIAGDRAYLAASNAGLRVIDVADPTAPAELGYYLPVAPRWVSQVAVSGNYAYMVGQNELELTILDVSNPSYPQHVSEYELEGTEFDVAVSDNLVFVTNSYNSLRVIDVTVPAAPMEILSFDDYVPDAGLSGGMAVIAQEDRVYLAEASVLHVLDVGEIWRPQKITSLDTPGAPAAMVRAGGLLFVADNDRGLRIFETGASGDLNEIGFFDTPGSAVDVTISDTLAYVADGPEGLRIINVADPEFPVEVGHADANGARAVSVAGGHAFVPYGSVCCPVNTAIIDISNPAVPQRVATYPRAGEDVAVADDIMYLAAGHSLFIVDVMTPTLPVDLGEKYLATRIDTVMVSDQIAYLASGSSLYVLDVSRPESPNFVNSPYRYQPQFAVIHDMVQSGDRLYLATGANDYSGLHVQGLRVMDVSQPDHPQLIGSLNTGVNSSAVTISGSIAFLGDESGAILSVDIGNVNGAMPVGQHEAPKINSDIATSAGFIFVADGGVGLKVFELTMTGKPVWLATLYLEATNVAIDGDYAYVANRNSGFRVVDVSKPDKPRLIGRFDEASSVNDLALDNNKVYLADSSLGLIVVDVSSPEEPQLLGKYPEWRGIYKLAVDGDIVLVSNHPNSSRSLKVLDMAAPGGPLEIAAFDVAGRIIISGTMAYVINHDGLTVIDISEPSAPEVLAREYPGTGGTEVAITGNYAVVAGNDYADVIVLDVSNPYSPVKVGEYESRTGESLAQIALWDSYAVLGGVHTGLLVMNLSDATNFNYLPLIPRGGSD